MEGMPVKKRIFLILVCAVMFIYPVVCAETATGILSADDMIVGVKSYGFVDLEGAKVRQS